MPPEAINYGLRMGRAYVELTRALHQMLLPETAGHFGAENETLLVLTAIYIGDAENRPMSATKIAGYVGVPRASVYRRLERLTAEGRIQRCGRAYRLAPGTMRGDPTGQIRRIMARFVAG